MQHFGATLKFRNLICATDAQSNGKLKGKSRLRRLKIASMFVFTLLLHARAPPVSFVEPEPEKASEPHVQRLQRILLRSRGKSRRFSFLITYCETLFASRARADPPCMAKFLRCCQLHVPSTRTLRLYFQLEDEATVSDSLLKMGFVRDAVRISHSLVDKEEADHATDRCQALITSSQHPNASTFARFCDNHLAMNATASANNPEVVICCCFIRRRSAVFYFQAG